MLPHKDVLIRLWPWDISPISTGFIPESADRATVGPIRVTQAISSANHLASEKLNLAMQLCSTGPNSGINHPVLLDYLSHQTAQQETYSSNANGDPDSLDKEQTKELIQKTDPKQL
jgi:hypothetical protein